MYGIPNAYSDPAATVLVWTGLGFGLMMESSFLFVLERTF